MAGRGVEYTIGAPRLKWAIVMLAERMSVLNDSPVQFSVSASYNGKVYDPRSGVVSMAFLPAWGNPATGDWHVGNWDVTSIGTYVAQINPGPSGLALAIGTYYAWVKIVDSFAQEMPIEQVGELIVQ